MTGKKVLIFEDNSSIRKLLELFFKKRGFNTVLAEDGVDAVQLAADNGPDLIVMDLIMPGKDGIEAARDLRSAGVKTPIIMMTSKAYTDDKKRAIDAGVTVYMLKPFNPAKFEETIRPLLSA
jgi:DNA-binding response OmpR family regulator